MKRIYFLLLIAIVTLNLQACKKNSPLNPQTKTYLLYRLTFISSNSKTIQEYSYDSKNRLTETNINANANKVKYVYIYDNQDKLIKVEYYTNDNLYTTQTYSYVSGAINITEKYSDGSTFNKAFELTGNRVTRYFNYNLNETTTYFYDAKGNISSLHITNMVYSGTWSYTYDDKKHPFSMIGAPNPHLFFLEQPAAAYSNINNAISSTLGANEINDYIYNGDGFPVRVVTHDIDNRYSYTVTYEYIVR